MKKVTLIIDGKEIKARVREEDLEQIKKKLDVGRQVVGEEYFYLQSNLEPISSVETLVSIDEDRYNSGNYFLTEKECEDAARVVSLWLRMKRFADEHNERKIDFNNCHFDKYYFYYDSHNNRIVIETRASWHEAFQIYFDSKETAQKAINEFYDELMWYFTEYSKNSKITTSRKEVQYEVNVGSGCSNGTVFVDENATDEEIRLAIMDDLYDVDYHEVIKEEN